MGRHFRLVKSFSFWAFSSWMIAIGSAGNSFEPESLLSMLEQRVDGGPTLPPLQMAGTVTGHFSDNRGDRFWMDERQWTPQHTDHLKARDTRALGGSMRAMDLAQYLLVATQARSFPDNEKPRKTFDDLLFVDDCVKSEYDDSSRLIRQVFTSGKVVNYFYCPAANSPSSILTGDEQTILRREFFIYGETGLLSTYISDNGSGNLLNDLTSVTQRLITRFYVPSKRREEIEYLFLDLSSMRECLLQRRVRKFDRFGNAIGEEVYDSEGSLHSSCECRYDNQGRTIWKKDSLGYQTAYEYDGRDNLICQKGPKKGFEKHFGYDDKGRLIAQEYRISDAFLSQKISYDDSNHRVLTSDFSGNITQYQYDERGRCIEIVYPEIASLKGRRVTPKESFVYDKSGRVCRHIDRAVGVTEISYYDRGEPLKKFYPDGTQEGWEWGPDGNLLAKRMKDGRRCVYEYDVFGRVIRELWYGADGVLNRTLTRKFDGFNLLEEVDGEGNTTYYGYDSAGRLAYTCLGKIVTKYEYDALGHFYRIIEGGEEEATVTVGMFDANDNLIEERVENSLGCVQKLIEYGYDENNCLNSVTHYRQEGPQTTKIDYDLLNRPVKIVDPKGDATTIEYEPHYRNHLGQSVLRISVHGPDREKWTLLLDSGGRVVKRESLDIFGETLSELFIDYDLGGRVSVIFESELVPLKTVRSVEYTWSPGGKLTSFTNKEGQVFRYSYNELGQRIKEVKPDGASSHYSYDAMGREQYRRASDDIFSYRYDYDKTDRLVKVEDLIHHKTSERGFDSEGKLSFERPGNGIEARFTYDSLGRRKKVTLPDGGSINYEYSGSFLLAVRRLDAEGEERYQHRYLRYGYDGSLLEAKGLGNTGTSYYHYDRLGNLEALSCNYYKELSDSECGSSSVVDSWGEHRVQEFKSVAVSHLDLIGGSFFTGLQTLLNYHLPDEKVLSVGGADESRDSFYDSWGRLLVERCGRGYVRRFYEGIDEIGAVDDEGRVVDLRIFGRDSHELVAIELEGKVYAPILNRRGDVVALIGEDGRCMGCYRYDADGRSQAYPCRRWVLWGETAIERNPWRRKGERMVYQEDSSGGSTGC